MRTEKRLRRNGLKRAGISIGWTQQTLPKNFITPKIIIAINLVFNHNMFM